MWSVYLTNDNLSSAFPQITKKNRYTHTHTIYLTLFLLPSLSPLSLPLYLSLPLSFSLINATSGYVSTSPSTI